jgi:hypothetical protein
MKKLDLVIAFACLLWCVGAPAAKAQNEGLDFKLDADWKIASHSETFGLLTLEFIRKGEDINDWKELFTYQNGELARKHHTPEETLSSIKALREKECPGVTTWSVIEQNASDILYEWHAKPCRGWAEQCEIARIIDGNQNLYILHYAARVHEIAPDTRAQWIKTIADATVNPNTHPLYPTTGVKEVDELVPFATDKVMAALKPAMENEGCNVKEATAERVECKRKREFTGSYTSGGESVTATLEAQGMQTRVHIWTGKGFYGRLAKENWSTSIYMEMMVNLQKDQP